MYMSGEGTQTLHYAELAQRRNECAKLTCFIKLIDYLLVDTMHRITVSGVSEILSRLKDIQSTVIESSAPAYCQCKL